MAANYHGIYFKALAAGVNLIKPFCEARSIQSKEKKIV